MSGAFYGSLAASASVFVAILTALLVNNYVQIKSDRRQVKNELDRIEEDLEGLRDRRDDYKETVEGLVEKREADYREKAKKQVKEFVDSEIPSGYSKPIEKLTVDELYQDLIDFHDYDSAEELEDSSIKPHHRELLEDQIDEIEDQILNEIVPPFASKYEGEGWDPESDPDHTSLTERMEELKNEEEDSEEDDGSDSEEEDSDDSDMVVEVEDLGRDPLELDEFIEKYKEEYGLDSLDDKTQDALETQYEKVVDKNPYPRSSSSASSSLSSPLGTNPYSSIQPDLREAARAASRAGGFDDPISGIDFGAINTVLGLSVQEQQKLETARENLQDKENEIEILKQRKGRLEREKERLHPEDLNTTLYANVATIFLSVVIPMAAYLDIVTEFTISELGWINIWMIAGSWLLGLLIVFAAIYIRINKDD